ncbi:host specificity protein J [Acinetobacter guillouiae]|uniref:host specificity protein J n=1 Tax=Acinetobacter guillouiae TaxID=106649 RepID=UPI002FDA07B5
MNTNIKGAKAGSSKSRTPVVASDSAQSIVYYEILMGMAEGEIEGLANGWKSVYLDDTPILDASGNSNFESVMRDFRTGTNDQDYIEGFVETSNINDVNVELTTQWVRSISNTSIDALRVLLRFGALRTTNPKNGDVTGVLIKYAIDISTDGAAYVEMINTAIDDKTSDAYVRPHRIDLPKAQTGWNIRVRRLTPPANSDYITDKMYIDSYSEVIDAKLSYPNTALLSLQYDAQTFSNAAKVAVEAKGIKVRVPTNYDPESRQYVGIWDGSFKRAYSNNPAWIYYDLCTAKRYGLGERITDAMLDKASLYRLAQYCDGMVSDGEGGLEPRFTCNIYIQSAEDAYSILTKLAGLFRAISYWDGDSIICEADAPDDVYYAYTNANVIDGNFEGSGTRNRDRHNVAKVAWDDPKNRYKTDYEIVRDERAIAEAKAVRIVDVDAWGCTSRGQAQRAGLWALRSEQNETQTVTFKVGLEGQITPPGKIISVADNDYAGRFVGGRIKAISADRKTITLDRDVLAQPNDTIYINGESGQSVQRQLASINGQVVTVTQAFNVGEIAAQNAWNIDSTDLKTRKFRVVSLTQDDEHQFTITAIEYNSAKYDAIDNGAFIDDVPTTIINPVVQAPATNVQIESYDSVQQGINIATMIIKWVKAEYAVKYLVEWRKDNDSWIKMPTTGATSVEIPGIYAGNYQARVTAISAFDITSLATSSVLTTLQGKQGKPPKLANLRAEGILFGMKLTWLFPAVGALDTAYTEIEVSPDGASNIAQLGLFAYPTTVHTIQGMQPNLRQFYRGRLIDRIGNIGDWSDWVSGVTSADASDVLELLNEQITESQLHKDLQTKIDHIETIDAEIGPIKQDIQNTKDQISQEIIDRQSAIQQAKDGLSQQISDGDDAVLEVVDTVKKSSDAGIAAAQSEIKVVADNLKLTAEKTDGVYAQLNPPLIGSSSDLIGNDQGFAGTWSLQSAMIEGDLVLSKRIDTTVAQVNDVQAFAQQEVIARIEGDKATVQKIDTYIVENDQALATVRNSAQIAVEQSTANAELINALELELDDKASTGQLTQVKSEIEQDYNGKITAQTTRIDGVYAQVNPPLIGSESDLIGNNSGYAGVWSEQSARIEGDLAQSIRTDQVTAQMNQNDALYQQQIKATADAVSANVKLTETLQTKVGDNEASIQEVAESTNGLYAQKFTKIDVNGKVIGWGGANDGVEGQYIFDVDSLAIGRGDSVGYYPFIFRTTPFTDPVTGTVFPVAAYLKSVFMDYQSVKTSHIEDLAVKTAKIEDLAVTAGKIKDLAVGTLKIQDEAVTVPTSIKSTSEIVVSGAYSPQYSDYNSQLAEWEAKFGNLLTATINRSGGKCRIDASCIAFKNEYLTAYAVDGGSLSYFERLNLRAVVSIYRNGTLVARQETPPTDVMSSGGFYFTGTFAVNAGIEDIFSGPATYVLKLGFANRNTRAIRITLNSTTGIFSIQSPQMILTEMKK